MKCFKGQDKISRFEALQRDLATQFEQIFPFAQLPRTIVVIPSLSLDAYELSKISGVHHYEERMLCLLMLLRMPRSRVVYVTSLPIHPTIIDYYLHLLPGIPVNHARKRLTLLSCHDASSKPLSEKILARPRLLRRIQTLIAKSAAAHMTCFNTTPLERDLSLALGIPLYAVDPSLTHLGSKSGSREIFRDAGIPMPAGFEHLRDAKDIAQALVDLKRAEPEMRRAVVKLNEGFSGEGNALFSFEGLLEPLSNQTILGALPNRLAFEAKDESWAGYENKFEEMGGIVEAFIEGDIKRSPSVQCRVNPLGEVHTISTHDQVLTGPSGQIFEGCTFPAADAYRIDIQHAGMLIAEKLKGYGVLGRFGIDFISVKDGDTWHHYAIEINLRKGGTTHPFLMLQYLIDGHYNEQSGLYMTPDECPRFYYASDQMRSNTYQGLTPDDLIDIAVSHDLHFHGSSQQGVVFHLIGALSEFGKLGVVCIGDSPQKARTLYENAVEVLEKESLQATCCGACKSYTK